MKIRAAAFTDRGAAWSEALGFLVERPARVMDWTEEAFGQCDALLFIGAAGIAVRAIARHVRSKTTDPAVLVMDEWGQHVIPILSGHIGGANELACEVAGRVGAEAVLTTATDLGGVPAIDLWAVKNDCAIENPEAIKSISAAALAGREVGVMITERRLKPPFETTLILRPRTLVVGAGCRRGVEAERFEAAALDFLERAGVSLLSVRALASIDRKADERALCRFAEKYQLPFVTHSAEALARVEGVFAHSEAALRAVGVGNVCERAAVLVSGGRLLCGKTVYPGITLSLAGEEIL